MVETLNNIEFSILESLDVRGVSRNKLTNFMTIMYAVKGFSQRTTSEEKQTPPKWTDRDDNASQNLTYLHWIDTQKAAPTQTNYPITQQLDTPTLSLEESTSRRRHSTTDESQV